jgi:anthranilate phosphoribosyltransferase
MISPAQFGQEILNAEQIYGGEDIPTSARMFMQILEGNGTKAQTSAVISNTGLALHVLYPEQNLENCVETARKALLGGKALEAFKKLIKRQ